MSFVAASIGSNRLLEVPEVQGGTGSTNWEVQGQVSQIAK
jgi:hypothetical protein